MSTKRSISQFQRQLYTINTVVASLNADIAAAVANGDDATDLLTALAAAVADRPTDPGTETADCYQCGSTVTIDESMAHVTVVGFSDGSSSETFDVGDQVVVPLCGSCITALAALKAAQEVTDDDIAAAKAGYMP